MIEATPPGTNSTSSHASHPDGIPLYVPHRPPDDRDVTKITSTAVTDPSSRNGRL